MVQIIQYKAPVRSVPYLALPLLHTAVLLKAYTAFCLFQARFPLLSCRAHHTSSLSLLSPPSNSLDPGNFHRTLILIKKKAYNPSPFLPYPALPYQPGRLRYTQHGRHPTAPFYLRYQFSEIPSFTDPR